MPNIVETTAGKVRGYRDQAITVFKGIPYGAPPSGAARFTAPKPARAWSGVVDATQYGPYAMQRALPGSTTMEEARHNPRSRFLSTYGISPFNPDQSEASLVLNVWTPGADSRKRPVMFRIHGGGFQAGSGAWRWLEGTRMALRGDAVVVTVNHRLNVLGYLHLADIGGAQYAGSGNAGMLDLVLALEWVRDNIAAFGGNPENLTIFGESGGGAKVSTLLAMPAAKGLFRHAILQSATLLPCATRDDATVFARRVLDHLQIAPTSLDRLADVPVEKLFEAEDAASLAGGGVRVGPVVDGDVLPLDPVAAAAEGASAGIPLIVGTNLMEGVMLHEPLLDQILGMTEASLRERVRRGLGDRADAMIDGYRGQFPDATPGELFLIIEAGGGWRKAAIDFLDARAKSGGAPVYAYVLAWRSRGNNGRALASHGIEVPLTMDNVQISGAWVADDPTAQAMADQMSSAWLAFGRCGVPDHPGIPHWAPHAPPERNTMVFDHTSHMEADPFREAVLWKDGPGPFLMF